VGVADQNLKCNKALTYYKIIVIFLLPLVTFALYVVKSSANAFHYFEKFNGETTDEHLDNIIGGCLYFWNGILVVLSCIHLAYFLNQV
jgi:hypothetical protein